jgi:hypothetical protein
MYWTNLGLSGDLCTKDVGMTLAGPSLIVSLRSTTVCFYKDQATMMMRTRYVGRDSTPAASGRTSALGGHARLEWERASAKKMSTTTSVNPTVGMNVNLDDDKEEEVTSGGRQRRRRVRMVAGEAKARKRGRVKYRS